MAAFNTMWSTVTSQYGSNSRVYFSAPAGRVLIGGTGYSQDLRPICDDARFNGTLLSFHHYAFFYGENDYAGWRSHVQTRLGNCASRAVVTEFGAPMDNGLNYASATTGDNFVNHIRAVTDVMRANGMGGTYWPAIGGKPGSIGYDWYSMYALSGSGANLNLTVRNNSGADRLQYAWGDDIGGGGSTTVDLRNRNSGKCVDVVGGSSANGAEIIQYDCHGGSNQQWELANAGGGYYRIVSEASGKCLDVDAASTANNARILLWTCNGGTNQQWQLRTTGNYVEIVARHSGKCLDVISSSTANGTRLQQYDCVGGTNQHWSA
ncbi:RICIN domain-containing protein [Glycomyces sp. NRRL B-16210]|uniref:RICIN domain-containing protein n=1 Tax=Glycomyces sp. NRRL B-16210 TaxID=1463821 RepID=UPI000B299810|nr:RICIN domain-containing protein [Glycomyces sp. NRRL B-16210]